MIEPGDYGTVEVLAGPHAGKLGYYDDDYEANTLVLHDDDDEEEELGIEPNRAVVYFGVPFESEFELIPHCDLRKTNLPHLELEQWLRDNPDMANDIDVRR